MKIKRQMQLVQRVQSDLYKEAGKAKTEIAKTEFMEQGDALNYVIHSLHQLSQLQAVIRELLTDENPQ